MSLKTEDMRGLDQVRQRLDTLNGYLEQMMKRFTEAQPLLDWPTIASYQNTLALTLGQLNDTLVQHGQLLKEAHVYPLSTFPGHTQEGTLQQILSKKLQPPAEAWIEDFTTKAGNSNGMSGSTSNGREDMNALWSWASSASQGIVGPMLQEDMFMEDFTLAETEGGVENVKTGLRRKLWDDESGDEDDSADKMEEDVMPAQNIAVEEGVDVALPPLPLEAVMKFMVTGALPSRPNR